MRIIIHSDAAKEALRTGEVAEFLRGLIPAATVEERGELFSYCWSNYDVNLIGVAEAMARSRVRDISGGAKDAQAMKGEVEYELRCLRNPSNITAGVVYDGIEFLSICAGALPPDCRVADCVTLIFTGRLLATFSVEDGRCHARSAVFGVPCAVSLSGIVEAPAKPKEYYRLKREAGAGVPVEVLKEQFGRMFIDYGDDRMTEVCKGYSLQALFYLAFGDPFCGDRDCRLFNAHWQEDLIHSQVKSGKLCDEHQKMLAGISR